VRAVLTSAAATVQLADVPEPDAPGRGEVLVRPEAVGICGSDLHFLTGELVTPPAFGPQYPRVQGHETAGVIEALGPDCPPHLTVGMRVAVWPLSSCGRCRACRIGRGNACPHFRLVGIHADGALAERVVVAARQVFDVADLDPVLAAFCEPMSIAVHALDRGEVTAGQTVAVLGAGAIGQAVAIGARDRGAAVLLSDVAPARLALGAADGVTLVDARNTDVGAAAREWSDGDGPGVVIDCTGVPSVLTEGVAMAASAGRVVVVGIAHQPVTLPLNAFTDRELDLVGSTVCSAADFAAAVDLVLANRARIRPLITREVPVARAPQAIGELLADPGAVLKLVVRIDEEGTW
jgi:2-desacetyl-2-hydroxyethyl bacteriochlorophyllide A dehydrogenase